MYTAPENFCLDGERMCIHWGGLDFTNIFTVVTSILGQCWCFSTFRFFGCEDILIYFDIFWICCNFPYFCYLIQHKRYSTFFSANTMSACQFSWSISGMSQNLWNYINHLDTNAYMLIGWLPYLNPTNFVTLPYLTNPIRESLRWS